MWHVARLISPLPRPLREGNLQLLLPGRIPDIDFRGNDSPKAILANINAQFSTNRVGDPCYCCEISAPVTFPYSSEIPGSAAQFNRSVSAMPASCITAGFGPCPRPARRIHCLRLGAERENCCGDGNWPGSSQTGRHHMVGGRDRRRCRRF